MAQRSYAFETFTYAEGQIRRNSDDVTAYSVIEDGKGDRPTELKQENHK